MRHTHKPLPKDRLNHRGGEISKLKKRQRARRKETMKFWDLWMIRSAPIYG